MPASLGMPGILTAVAVIVAVCRAEPGSLAEIIRAAEVHRATGPPGHRDR